MQQHLVRYVGGVDAVDLFCPSTGRSFQGVERGVSLMLFLAEVDGLEGNADWKVVFPKQVQVEKSAVDGGRE